MKQQGTTIRLDKFLANAGLISRRGVKQFLKENTITIDGKRATESGTRVGQQQQVLLNGTAIKKPGFVYFMLNKPIGIISSTADEFARDTVISLIDTNERIYPVGRLDKDTHGLVLLTNDGELTHQLIHPKYHVAKVYRLTVAGMPNRKQIEQLREGVILTDGITLPAEVQMVENKKVVISNEHERSRQKISRQTRNVRDQSIVEVSIHEGRNRQIRRMCEAVGIQLLDLQRIAFGPLQLGNLKKGEYRELTKQEVQKLRNVVAKK